MLLLCMRIVAFLPSRFRKEWHWTKSSEVDLEEQIDNEKNDGKKDDGKKDDGENEVVKPKEYNIRPITFPIYNFIILVIFVLLWVLYFYI